MCRLCDGWLASAHRAAYCTADDRGHADAAEHEEIVPRANAHSGGQRQVPAVGIVRRAQVEKQGIAHGALMQRAALRCKLVSLTGGRSGLRFVAKTAISLLHQRIGGLVARFSNTDFVHQPLVGVLFM